MFQNLYDNIITHKKYNPYALEKKLRKSFNMQVDFNYLGFSLNWIDSCKFHHWLFYEHEFRKIYNVNNARAHQHKRVKDKIAKILANNDFNYFITFTFNDKALELKENTRKQYVSRFLSRYCNDYIANIDYGKKNGREHYHAIGSIPCDTDDCIWKYGFIDIVPIRSTNDDVKLAYYLNKLSNHALKEHGKRKHLIYCRK